VKDQNELLELCRQRRNDLKPGGAIRIAGLLGPLASWWLPSDILSVATQQTRCRWPEPRLEADHGACWIVLANTGGWPLLRNAIVLPLAWQRDTEHSRDLPEGLRVLADEVRDGLERPDWGLHWHETIQPSAAALQGLFAEMGFASGWAPLAAGLIIAAEGGQPDPHVWATGIWNRRGIQSVSHLEEKLGLASDHGAVEFFVPESNRAEAESIIRERGLPQPRIGILKAGTPERRTALCNYLVRLKAQPEPPQNADDRAGFDRCVRHHLGQPREEERTTQFYWSHLLPTIIERCRRQVQSQWKDWHPTYLVTIVSASPELVPITALALGVQQCVLLYTRDLDSNGEKTQSSLATEDELPRSVRSVVSMLSQNDIVSIPIPFVDNDAMQKQFETKLGGILGSVARDQLVIDITPGTKLMTLTLERAAPPESWLVYVRNDTLSAKDRRPKPGTERMVRWRAGEM
jgi:hypothetical protein